MTIYPLIKSLNIDAALIKLLRFYLRRYFVSYNQTKSGEFSPSPGTVPQGPLHGPLFFLLAVNDLHLEFKYCNNLMYTVYKY